MDRQALLDMRKQLGLDHMLVMPDPIDAGYERVTADPVSEG
jgi:hypothetical protein